MRLACFESVSVKVFCVLSEMCCVIMFCVLRATNTAPLELNVHVQYEDCKMHCAVLDMLWHLKSHNREHIHIKKCFNSCGCESVLHK